VPIVFVHVPDPVGAGFVDSLARPGGNATGFTQFEYSTAGKWLELLKEIASSVTRAAVLRDAAITAGIGQWSAIQSVATARKAQQCIKLGQLQQLRKIASGRNAPSSEQILGHSETGRTNLPIVSLTAAKFGAYSCRIWV
jgi:hypothetical protein